MTDTEFDRAVIGAAFAQAGALGWHRMSLPGAARDAGLDLARVRARFPGRCAVLLRFGSLADQSAVTGIMTDAPVRDTLFDMLMRRIDVLQAHRAGVQALFRALPFDPATGAMLGAASLRSMAWLLDAAGASRGIISPLRAKGLLAVWLWTVRAWQKDDSTDLGATMAALDQALGRAETAERWFQGRRAAPESPVAEVPPTDEPQAAPTDPSPPA